MRTKYFYRKNIEWIHKRLIKNRQKKSKCNNGKYDKISHLLVYKYSLQVLRLKCYFSRKKRFLTFKIVVILNHMPLFNVALNFVSGSTFKQCTCSEYWISFWFKKKIWRDYVRIWFAIVLFTSIETFNWTESNMRIIKLRKHDRRACKIDTYLALFKNKIDFVRNIHNYHSIYYLLSFN